MTLAFVTAVFVAVPVTGVEVAALALTSICFRARLVRLRWFFFRLLVDVRTRLRSGVRRTMSPMGVQAPRVIKTSGADCGSGGLSRGSNDWVLRPGVDDARFHLPGEEGEVGDELSKSEGSFPFCPACFQLKCWINAVDHFFFILVP